jgi:hypothetical protein
MSTNETQASGQGEAVELEGSASWTTNGTEPAGQSTADDVTSPSSDTRASGTVTAESDRGATGEVDEFLASLADAMHSTASSEHARIAEATEQKRQAYLSQLTAREASEADELRETTEQDVKAIHSWADREISRIRNEREQRIASRRQELDVRLDEHHSLIAREVEAVEAKVSTFLADVEIFFNELEAESDPIALARRARSRPALPDLSAAEAPETQPAETTSARDEATPSDRDDRGHAGDAGVIIGGDTPMVAVMAEPVTTEQAQPGKSAEREASPEEPVPVEAVAQDQGERGEGAPTEDSDAAKEPVEVGADRATEARENSGTLLQTVPSHRPMSLLSRLASNIAERSDPPS